MSLILEFGDTDKPLEDLRMTLDGFNSFDDLITNSPFKDIMDEGSLEDFA